MKSPRSFLTLFLALMAAPAFCATLSRSLEANAAWNDATWWDGSENGAWSDGNSATVSAFTYEMRLTENAIVDKLIFNGDQGSVRAC